MTFHTQKMSTRESLFDSPHGREGAERPHGRLILECAPQPLSGRACITTSEIRGLRPRIVARMATKARRERRWAAGG